MATCIVILVTLCHENITSTASLCETGCVRACAGVTPAIRIRPYSLIRNHYLQQVTAVSERTAPVVEVAMYVRVTQHDGNLHPHSATSSVADASKTWSIHVLGIGERAPAQVAL
jgi:hypothetical protein